MSRNPELEAILEARYSLETCEPKQKTERRAQLDALLDASLSKSARRNLSRRQLIEILAEPYQEFKRVRQDEERTKLSRLR